MSMPFENPLYRLNTLLTMFQAERAAYSVNELAEILGIPAGVVRDDILALHNNKEIGITFSRTNNEETVGRDFMSLLQTGRFDDTQLTARSLFVNDVFLPLTQFELECLKEFEYNKGIDNRNIYHNYITKQTYNQSKGNIQVKVAQLEKIISDERSIRIYYKAGGKAMTVSDIRPLKIVHVANMDRYYVICVIDDKIAPYRIDRIKNYELLKSDIEVPDLSPLNDIPNIWGMELGERVHVKIWIKDEGRVVEKVKKDLEIRVNGKWINENGRLYFEDDVIGINSFREWINGYGSSVLVIEPLYLREEIISSAHKRLEKYMK